MKCLGRKYRDPCEDGLSPNPSFQEKSSTSCSKTQDSQRMKFWNFISKFSWQISSIVKKCFLEIFVMIVLMESCGGKRFKPCTRVFFHPQQVQESSWSKSSGYLMLTLMGSFLSRCSLKKTFIQCSRCFLS